MGENFAYKSCRYNQMCSKRDMRFKGLVEKTCRDTSIHGLPYLIKRDLHWTERIFWGAIILSATCFSIYICLNQWQRFRQNPIVYAVEMTWGTTNVYYAGITLCSLSISWEDMRQLIVSTWSDARDNQTKFEYYSNFLLMLSALNLERLQTLAPYVNDTSLKEVSFLKMLLALHKNALPPMYKNDNGAGGTTILNREQIYAPAITEAGLCLTTSQLSEYTNPFGEFKHLPVNEKILCNLMNECNMKVIPLVSNTELSIYLHNVDDVVEPFDRKTIKRVVQPENSLGIELLLSLTTADGEVRSLPISYRKCRYEDENNLKYFKTYRPGLCRTECRIDAALALCGCKPFFYAVARGVPVCDIQGMFCLEQQKWKSTSCGDCVPLCVEKHYLSTYSTEQKDDSSKFERTIVVKHFLPRTALKRRVVFNAGQLMMSFGGAIGLLLGASFISVYSLLYILGEYIISNCVDCFRKCRNRSRVHAVKTV